MVGPVLAQEMILGSRRSWQHVFRRIYTGWLIVLLLLFYWIYVIQSNYLGSLIMGVPRVPGVASHFAATFVETLVWQQFILIVLVTPAFTAGAITDEKSRGTLQYLLAADLTSWEIILGKLIGRVAQVAVLALAALPLLCFIGVFGGVTFSLLFALFAVAIVPVLALAAASLLASVWSRQTRDAVLGIYICVLASFLLLWLTGLLQYFDPLYVLAAVQEDTAGPNELMKRLFISILAWGSIGSLCLGLAAWRLRPAYLRQLEGEGRPKKVRWWRARRASVPEDPIRWKERHVEGIAPLATLRRIPRWIGVVAISAITVASSIMILANHLQRSISLAELGAILSNFDFFQLSTLFWPAADAFLLQAVIALLVATLLVGVRCSGAITGERERQTWEALLLTPVPVRYLIRGKLWGIIGASYPYLLAYAIPATAFSFLGGIEATLQTIVCFGVTWLAMGFIGAAGLWCSARFKSSWRSLLGAIAIGYGTGFVLFVIALPAAGIVFLIVWVTLSLLDYVYGTNFAATFTSLAGFFKIATQIALVIGFLLATGLFLSSTQRYIADRERIRHWKEEPKPGPRRRPRRALRAENPTPEPTPEA
ncbi:MAG TPA: ABC transporter permease subunit [Gemmataceae bacterium]|nr:ABC transporter permease subunit [Gemmataceae bacterium]